MDYAAKIAAILKRLAELQQMESRSADDEGEIDRLMAEYNDLKPKHVREQQIAAAAAESDSYNAPAGRRATAALPKGSAQPVSDIDMRSLGKRFIDSDAFKQFRGQKKSDPFEATSFYHRNQQAQHVDGMGPEELRALIYTGGLTVDMIQPQVIQGIMRGDDKQGSLRDVLINGQTTSDAIVYFRELLFTNNAAGVAEATATAGSTGLKPESSITFEQDTASVKTIAHWIPITRQILQDASQMQTYVEQRLLDGLRLEESEQLLVGAGGNDLTGLNVTSGVQILDAAHFAGAPVVDDGNLNENFNRILRGKTKVRLVGRARASFAVLNPSDMEYFLSITNQSGNYYGAGPFSTGMAIPNLWGLRVVEDENQTAGKATVGDGRMAAIWDRMQAQIFVDTINDQFVRNMLTLLAEERLALTVFRPAAFAVVSLAAWS